MAGGSKSADSTTPAICVVGGGSWATALVKILSENRDLTHWYLRNPAIIASIRLTGHNERYLTDVHFDTARLVLHEDLKEAIEAADVLLLAVPSAFLASTLEGIGDDIQNKMVFSAIKGIVPESGLIVGEHLHQVFGLPYSQIGVVTGPCHAEEVALEKLSYLTVASADEEKAREMAQWLDRPYIRTKVSDDIFGTEYAAVLKNIYAIASGMAHGLGYGDNFQSVLISNSLREMKRFIDRVHPIHRDIKDSAYLGDLLVTAYSIFSRNRTFGTMVGKGYTVRSAMLEMNMIAEGYYAAKSVFRINRGLDQPASTPIIDAVHAILYERAAPKATFRRLESQLD